MNFEEWSDPYPKPVLEEHNGITVVRDDLLEAGSKTRFLDFLVRTAVEREIVYAATATGYAQISLAYLANRYAKRAVLFMAERDETRLHLYQRRAIEQGAKIHWVPSGMLTVTNARAREYARENPKERLLMPMGLAHPTMIASIVKVARSLPIKPTEVWSVAGSGTLSRGLQIAFPDVEVHAVSVGHKLTAEERGRARVWRCALPFDKAVPASQAPPFPSAPTYDAKAWKFIRAFAKPGALFWNVGA